MSTLISKLIVACGFALATAALCVPAAAADQAHQNKAKPAAKAKAKAKKVTESHPKAMDVLDDEPEPDITDTTTYEYNCELKNKITIYQNDNDNAHIALRWKKRLHRLERVGTTTGAKRFENTKAGLVWIGIPSKGMLLDSKLNRQLANECRTKEQDDLETAKAQDATKT